MTGFGLEWSAFIGSALNVKTVRQFFRKVLVFQKTCFKFELLRTFKISSFCHVKTYPSLKRRTILKIARNIFLEKCNVFLMTLKENIYEEAFSCVETKTISHFAAKFVERCSHPFSIYSMTFHKMACFINWRAWCAWRASKMACSACFIKWRA